MANFCIEPKKGINKKKLKNNIMKTNNNFIDFIKKIEKTQLEKHAESLILTNSMKDFVGGASVNRVCSNDASSCSDSINRTTCTNSSGNCENSVNRLTCNHLLPDFK